MERIRYHAALEVTDRSIEQAFGRKIDEVVSAEKKEQIFEDSVRAMQEIFAEHGLSLPDDLLSRLHIVSEDDYLPFRMQGVSAALSSGIRLKGHAFVDYSTLLSGAAHNGFGYDDQLRNTGVHELAHIPEYAEIWVALSDSDGKTRRLGMKSGDTSGHGLSFEQRGEGLLSEGFTDIVTKEILERARHFNSTTVYPDEVELVRIIAREIGIDPFFQASYTKRGLRALYNALERQYGKKAFRRITKEIGMDEYHWIWGRSGDKRPKYSGTKKLLIG